MVDKYAETMIAPHGDQPQRFICINNACHVEVEKRTEVESQKSSILLILEMEVLILSF